MLKAGSGAWTKPGGCQRLPVYDHFFTSDLARTLTHLTADMAFFSPLPPRYSDYEKWKSVFNVIQEMEEVRYFVCIREKAGVFGRFSALQPLDRALSALIRNKHWYVSRYDFKWLYEFIFMNIPIIPLELVSISSSNNTASCRSLETKETSWCYEILKKLCCLK